GRQVLVEFVIDHHHWRAGAGRETLFFLLEEDAAIGGALAQLDAGLLLAGRHQGLGALQHAADVCADADVMPSARVGVGTGIESRDLVHLHRRQSQVLGYAVHELGREESVVLFLREAQCRQHGGALLAGGKAADPLVDLVAGVLVQHAHLLAHAGLEAAAVRGLHDVSHRSTSPNTMSWVPMTATTSASMWPRVISS